MSKTVAMLVTDAAKASVGADLEINFVRGCAAIDPAMTWEEPPTHWYANSGGVTDEDLQAWLAYATVEPELMLFVGVNIDNPSGWAVSNLASQGLQFVPAHEIE